MLSAVCHLMAVFPNFTHNILDLLTIRNATTPVAIPFCANLRILQIEIIIAAAQKGCGEHLSDFKHAFLLETSDGMGLKVHGLCFWVAVLITALFESATRGFKINVTLLNTTFYFVRCVKIRLKCHRTL